VFSSAFTSFPTSQATSAPPFQKASLIENGARIPRLLEEEGATDTTTVPGLQVV
jgi:hypothetical protein